jgi:L-ascorbate metabolism protein UlaG (beta-lactamase superfamily)
MKHRAILAGFAVMSVVFVSPAGNSPGPLLTRLANGEVLIQQATTPGSYQRIEAAPDVQSWTPLVTLLSTGALSHTDSAAPYFNQRFYRVQTLANAPALTGDHLATAAGEVIIHPVNHASFVMSWNGKTIYNDPVGSATLYATFPRADLILVSHNHSDHFSNTTLAAALATGGRIIAPQAVYDGMTTALRSATTIMLTGQVNPANNTAPQNVIGLNVAALPAYNTNHPLGSGNGYILTIGGKRIYMSGDTGDIAEMRALTNIDVAFICMNVPFTMSITQAASAIRTFRPRVVFPYHYRNQDGTYADLTSLKQMVGTDLGVEVRLRAWY